MSTAGKLVLTKLANEYTSGASIIINLNTQAFFLVLLLLLKHNLLNNKLITLH